MLAKVNMLGCAQITEYGSLSQILLSINKRVKNKTKKTLQEYLTNRLFKNFTDQSKTLALQLRVQVLHIDWHKTYKWVKSNRTCFCSQLDCPKFLGWLMLHKCKYMSFKKCSVHKQVPGYVTENVQLKTKWYKIKHKSTKKMYKHDCISLTCWAFANRRCCMTVTALLDRFDLFHNMHSL